MNRREFLASATGTGAVGLAGCLDLFGPCHEGETHEGTAVSLSNPVARRTDNGWRFSASIEIDFNFARSDKLGVETTGLRVYGPNRHQIGAVRLEGVQWGDLSEEQRRTDDCGYDHGSASVEASIGTATFPAWVEPIVEGSHRGQNDGIERLEYDGELPPEGDVTRNYTESPSLSKYWPPIDDNAAEPSDPITDLDFRVSECREISEPSPDVQWIGGGQTVQVRWYREFDNPCYRPLLDSVTYHPASGLLAARIGVHRVERIECPGTCAGHEYSLTVQLDGEIPEATRVTHLNWSDRIVNEVRVKRH